MELRSYVVSCKVQFTTTMFSAEVSMLYQPIIGSSAVALYYLLWHDLQTTKHSDNCQRDVDHLITLLGANYERFSKAKKQLEAIGLIKTFLRKKNNCYNFKLNPPLSGSEFFAKPDLVNLLKLHTTKATYQYVVDLFNPGGNCEVVELNISSSFGELYSHVLASKEQNFVFTFSKVDQYLKARNLEFRLYWPYKQEIMNKVHFLNIGTQDLPELIAASYTSQNKNTTFSCYDFSVQAEQRYNRLAAQGESMKNLKTTTTGNAEVLVQKIQEMELINNLDYIEMLYQQYQKELDPTVFQIIKGLAAEYKLKNGVINCLLEYTFINQQEVKDCPNIYFVAQQLKKQNINSAEETMVYLRGLPHNCKSNGYPI